MTKPRWQSFYTCEIIKHSFLCISWVLDTKRLGFEPVIWSKKHES